MSASSIINSATGKLFADLIPGGGGTEFTQEGQLIYGGQAPDFADQLLNIGNAGQILGVAGGIPAWQDAGGSGLITANLPIIEDADPAPNSKISINLSKCRYDILRQVCRSRFFRVLDDPSDTDWTVYWTDTAVSLERVLRL